MTSHNSPFEVIIHEFLFSYALMLSLSHLGPAVVVLQRVDGQRDHFDFALAEFTAQSGRSTQLCGAHRGEISGVGEQDSPAEISKIKEVIGVAVAGTRRAFCKWDLQAEVSRTTRHQKPN